MNKRQRMISHMARQSLKISFPSGSFYYKNNSKESVDLGMFSNDISYRYFRNKLNVALKNTTLEELRKGVYIPF